jgi:hypothetical protein
MTARTGRYVALTGLVTAVFCAIPALLLITYFGRDNYLFNFDDLIVKLTIMGSLGLMVMIAGLVISRAGASRREFQSCTKTG